MINSTDASQGVTSWPFHISMWILSTAGIVGNILVLVWRCWRKETRLELLSLLIVSLAVADLCFCMHFLLEEATLVDAIFGSKSGNETLPFTNVDERLCLSIVFLVYLSTNAIVLTVVAISLYSFLSFHMCRYRNRCIILLILISWMACLCLASLATWDVQHYRLPSVDPAHGISSEKFSSYVIFDCSDIYPQSLLPIITTTVNAVSSVIVSVLFICLGYKIRKSTRISNCLSSQEVSHFRTRLTIIAILNLVCWWPACILFWYTSFTKKSVEHGTLSPVVVQPFFILSVVVSVANPIIYTIASKRFCTAASRACHCCGFIGNHNEERLDLSLHVAFQGTESERHRCMTCCRLLCFRRRSRWSAEHMEEATEEESLFPDTKYVAYAKADAAAAHFPSCPESTPEDEAE